MEMYDFLLLSQQEQSRQVYKSGVFVGKRYTQLQTVVLYQLNGFYVEIFYRKYRLHISNVKAFNAMDRLDPYLAEMDVAEMISNYQLKNI